MGKYLKLFETTSQYEAYAASAEFIKPNVSICKDAPTVVHYNPSEHEETRLIVYYDIQDVSNPTTVCTNYDGSFKSMEVDGVDSVDITTQGNITYQFDSVGEHVIKYELNGLGVGTNAPLFLNLSTVKRVIIPNTFTSIGSQAFQGCSSLTSCTIGNGVTYIHNNAFANCSGLTSIVIPDSVTDIGFNAFLDCSSLTSVTVKATTHPALGDHVFDNNASGRKIYVPSASINDYKAAANWSVYADAIEPIS